jgi:hypothetical protein
MRTTRVVPKPRIYHGLAPLMSFADAISATKPDLIVSGDDLATRHLHHLYQRESKRGRSGRPICELIERSLGAPESFGIVYARTAFIQLAREQGIRAPETEVIGSIADLKRRIARTGLPVVLKTDGTSGGDGVRVVHTTEEAELHLMRYRLLRSLRARRNERWWTRTKRFSDRRYFVIMPS